MRITDSKITGGMPENKRKQLIIITRSLVAKYLPDATRTDLWGLFDWALHDYTCGEIVEAAQTLVSRCPDDDDYPALDNLDRKTVLNFFKWAERPVNQTTKSLLLNMSRIGWAMTLINKPYDYADEKMERSKNPWMSREELAAIWTEWRNKYHDEMAAWKKRYATWLTSVANIEPVLEKPNEEDYKLPNGEIDRKAYSEAIGAAREKFEKELAEWKKVDVDATIAKAKKENPELFDE